MNVKFLLFCIASLGSLMMLYMWFNANSTIKETQNNEEQYVYRISSLKSEIEVEKRLMDTLRKDVKSYSNSIVDKSSLIDKRNKEGVKFEKDKVKLEKEMETLRSDLDKLTNSNEDEKKKMENDYETMSKDENSQINSLESEIKKLTNEKKDLLEKQTKSSKNAKNSASNYKIIDNTMQGKAPKIKESKADDIQSDMKKPNQLNDPKNNIIMNQNNKEPKITKVKPDVEIKKSLSDPNVDINGENHAENKALNVKPVQSNDGKDPKNEFPIKNDEKPKLNQAKDNSQIFPPVPAANDLNLKKNKDSQNEQLNKKDFQADHQLKPPNNEKDLKDDFIKGGMLLKNKMKNAKDLEKDM